LPSSQDYADEDSTGLQNDTRIELFIAEIETSEYFVKKER
jgi:hypothetical protein